MAKNNKANKTRKSKSGLGGHRPVSRKVKAKHKLANDQYVEQANQKLAAKDFAGVEALCLKVLKTEPDNVLGCHLLGNAYLETNRDEKAIALLKKVIKLEPARVETYARLGQLLIRGGRVQEAYRAYETGLNLKRDSTRLYGYGNFLREAGMVDEAIEAFKESISVFYEANRGNDKHPVGAYFSLAMCYQDFGALDEAVTHFRKVIAMDPSMAGAYRSLAMTKKHTEVDDDVRVMLAQYEDKSNPPSTLFQLAFGLGKVYSDLKDYDRAFDFWAEGNRIVRSTSSYSASGHSNYLKGIQNTFNETLLTKETGTRTEYARPLFIVGMPRSGTTLTEQILASHPQVVGAGELQAIQRVCDSLTRRGSLQQSIHLLKEFPATVEGLNDGDWVSLGESYLLERDSRIDLPDSGIELVTDKNPLNFFFMGMIRKILPDALFVHCRRDPMATCLSIFQRHFPGGHYYSNDLEELGKFYNDYTAMMAYWDGVFGDCIFTVDYEDMVRDTEAKTREMLAFCGLPYDEACLKFYETKRQVNTASFAQVRKPIYKGSVEGWRHYEKQLEPLKLALGL